MSKQRIFIGVAWPYVNGDLHIGHVAGYLLPADIFARFNRLMGRDVLMVSGSDCFGTPITVEADKRKRTPQEIVEEYHKRDKKLFHDLEISYDLYTRTDTINHRRIVQEFLLAFWNKGLVKVTTQRQYFDANLQRFLPDRYVEGECPYCSFEGARSDQCDNCGKILDQNLINPVSKISGGSVILKDTEHLMIEWDKLEEGIKKYFLAKHSDWREWVAKETQNWLDVGLKGRAVTRDIDWGVEIPDKIGEQLPGFKGKRIYVWFDAVIGYYSASLEWSENTGKDWKPFWLESTSKHYYFMGKDNLVFHTIFWPGQLITFNDQLKLPDFPMINQFLNFQGQKFSKSRGLTIDSATFTEHFGVDSLRFYLTTIMPENSDSNFTWEDFLLKNNNLLVAQIGNYINRTLSIYKGYDIGGTKISENIILECKRHLADSINHLEKCEFKLHIETVLSLSHFANQYFNQIKPWELKSMDGDNFLKYAGDFFALGICIMLLMEPVTPSASNKFFIMLGLTGRNSWPNIEEIGSYLSSYIVQLKVSEVMPLFQKYSRDDVNAYLNIV